MAPPSEGEAKELQNQPFYSHLANAVRPKIEASLLCVGFARGEVKTPYGRVMQ